MKVPYMRLWKCFYHHPSQFWQWTMSWQSALLSSNVFRKCFNVSPGECGWLKLHGASRSGADARPLFERELQRGESEQHICSPDSTKQASWAEKECASTNFPRWTYAASKGAINILTKNMALDLAKYRIRVNSVSPGWIWSPEVAKVIFKSIHKSNHSDHSRQ